MKFLKLVVPLIWEASEKKTKKGQYKPRAVVHLDANITPSDVAPFLGEAVVSKIKFNYTGEVR